MRRAALLLLALASTMPSVSGAAATRTLPRSVGDSIGAVLTRIVRREVSLPESIRIVRIEGNRGSLTLHAGDGLSYYPFREENIPPLYDSIRRQLPAAWARARLRLITDRMPVEELVPRPLRGRADPGERFRYPAAPPLVRRLSSPEPDAGLAGRHIALWQSHGLYFDVHDNAWTWQRARLWLTIEDLYTQSYVLPFLVPMIERAGGCVLLPRERDVNRAEVVVDNDGPLPGGSLYDEYAGEHDWYTGVGTGFAHRRAFYTDGQNPFTEGSYRASATAHGADVSRIVWTPELPRAGEYAVHVAYRSLPGSTTDAHYTVHHAGGSTSYSVNQRMGGGTWVYLGTFRFAAGADPCRGSVELDNGSRGEGDVVTADAVRFGGGEGNIARIVPDSLRDPAIDYACQTSGHPRFNEGARYWLQWAGFPEEVYVLNGGMNDYKDDYMCRAHWVNALAGGSAALPDSAGMGIPVDLALAFHSDAGVMRGDSIVGTLGIFFTREGDGRYPSGATRYLARDLCDGVMTQICSDVRALCEPLWSRRGLWNRSYYEARVPAVPTMLLELLSHQNFADMRYGLDPRFRFIVSRAIYKAILRHLSYQYGTSAVVQPLPVHAFSATLSPDGEALLRWSPTPDPTEESARPDRYVVYTGRGDGSFDNGRMVDDTVCCIPVEPGRTVAFRVGAVNRGGESFPSETLALSAPAEGEECILIVNGFDRVSAPESIADDVLAGFFTDRDAGVPYLRDIALIGAQREYRRSEAFTADTRLSLGASDADCAEEVVAGNTFDYPVLHGRAIRACGYGFVSASASAVARGDVPLDGYAAVDLILGKQRTTRLGRGAGEAAFRCYPAALQAVLCAYLGRGGALFASGAYAGADLVDDTLSTAADRAFALEALHIRPLGDRAARRGRVRVHPSPARWTRGEYGFRRQATDEAYGVESPEGVAPAGEGAFSLLRYSENNVSAGVGYAGTWRSVVFGFPFESVEGEVDRTRLMHDVLDFLVTRREPSGPAAEHKTEYDESGK